MLRLIINMRPLASYLLIAWLLLMIIVSSVPNVPELKIHTARAEIRFDYLIHFCEYGLLAFLTLLSCSGKGYMISVKKVIYIAFCLILFAILDEFHQKLIPGRSFNLKDILSNLAGIIGATIITIVTFRMIRNKQGREK